MASFKPPVRSRSRNGRRAATSANRKPAAVKSKGRSKLKASRIHRVSQADAATRLAAAHEIPSTYTTPGNINARKYTRGETTTEWMAKPQMERVHKIMGNAKKIVDAVYPQSKFNIGPSIYNASFSNGSHEENNYTYNVGKSNVNIYPTLDEYIELKQTGSNTLDTLFKGEKPNTLVSSYKGITYCDQELSADINKDTLGTMEDVNLPMKSTTGLNRTGVFNPLGLYQWMALSNASNPEYSNYDFTPPHNQWAVGAKHSYIEALVAVISRWYQASGVTVPTSSEIIAYLLDYVKNISSSDRLTFPLKSIEHTYTFKNENALTPLYLSVYHCTPKQRLGKEHSPLEDWYDWQLGGGLPMPASYNHSAKADSDLAFPPRFSQYANHFADIHKNPTTGLPKCDFVAKTVANKVTMIASEIVPSNTPYQSQVFRNHWNVINNKKILLQPGQELKIHVKINLARPTDLREILLGDSTYYYQGLTYFPLIKFWGHDCVPQFKANPGAEGFQVNQLRTIQKPSSGAGIIVGSKRGVYKVAGSMPPQTRGSYQAGENFKWLNDFFGQMEGRTRQLSTPFRNLNEYGLSVPWASVNNNYQGLGFSPNDLTVTNPPMTTYFGLEPTATSMSTLDYADFNLTSIQPYLLDDCAELAEIFEETNVSTTKTGSSFQTN